MGHGDTAIQHRSNYLSIKQDNVCVGGGVNNGRPLRGPAVRLPCKINNDIISGDGKGGDSLCLGY